MTSGAGEREPEKPPVGAAVSGVEETPELKEAVTKEEHDEPKGSLGELIEKDEEEVEASFEKEPAEEKPEVEKEAKKKRRRRDPNSKKEARPDRKRRRSRKDKDKEPGGVESAPKADSPVEAEEPEKDRQPSEEKELGPHGLRPAPKPAASRGIPISEIFPRLLPPPPPQVTLHLLKRAVEEDTPRTAVREGVQGKRPRGSKGAKHRQRGVERRAAGYR